MSTISAARLLALPRRAVPVRLLGAGLLAATAWIHLHLWQIGYRDVHVIGPLFLLNAVSGAGAALLLLAVHDRYLPVGAALGGLFELGTLGGLVISTTVGLFGFTETWRATLVPQSVVVESAGGLLLLGYAALAWARRGRRAG